MRETKRKDDRTKSIFYHSMMLFLSFLTTISPSPQYSIESIANILTASLHKDSPSSNMLLTLVSSYLMYP